MVTQIPVLETPDGPIFESNAIARYGRIQFIYLFSDFGMIRHQLDVDVFEPNFQDLYQLNFSTPYGFYRLYHLFKTYYYPPFVCSYPVES